MGTAAGGSAGLIMPQPGAAAAGAFGMGPTGEHHQISASMPVHASAGGPPSQTFNISYNINMGSGGNFGTPAHPSMLA